MRDRRQVSQRKRRSLLQNFWRRPGRSKLSKSHRLGIETLERRQLLAFNAGPHANDGFPDVFILQANVNPSLLDFYVNGNLNLTVPLASLPSPLVVQGSNDNDTFIINYNSGNPIPSGGITVNGGNGFDTLQVLGGNFSSITKTFTNATDGGIVLNQAGPLSRTINYTGLDPVLLNVGTVADIVFNLPNAVANTNVVVADDLGGLLNTSEIRGSTFEDTAFTNPGNSLTVNAGPFGDIITLNIMDSTFNPAGGFTVNGGAAGDTFHVNSTFSATTLNGLNGGDQFNIGSIAGNLSALLGPVTVNGQGGTDQMIVNDQTNALNHNYTVTSSTVSRTSFAGLTYAGLEGLTLTAGTGNNNILISSTAAGTPVAINANSGDDLTDVGAGNLDNILSFVTVNGNAHFGADNLLVNDSLNGFPHSFTISGTSVIRSGVPILNYGSTELLQVLGGSAANAFNVTPSLNTEMSIIGGNPTSLPGDTLTYNGLGTKTISGPGAGALTQVGFQTVNFGGIEHISSTGTLNDLVNVAALPGGVDGNSNRVRIVRNGANIQFFYDGNTGDAAPEVLLLQQLYSSTGTLGVVGAGDNDEVFVDHSGGPITRNLTFSGGAQTNITFGDALRFAGGSFLNVVYTHLTASSGNVNVDGTVFTYTGLEPIFDNMNAVNRTFNFNNNTQTITLDDDINQPGGPLAGMSELRSPGQAEIVFFSHPTGSLNINGGSGGNVIRVFPNIDAGFNTPTINIDSGTGNDEVRVLRTPAGTTTNINTQNGALDRTVVGADVFPGNAGSGLGTLNNILGQVNVDDTAGNGELFVDASGDVAGIYNLTATQIDRGVVVVTYSPAINPLHLATGSGDDIVNVLGTSATTNTVFTNGGNDEIRVMGVAGGDNLHLELGAGIFDRTVIGAPSFAAFNTGVGSLANVQGNVNVNHAANPFGETYIDNSGDATNGRIFNFNNNPAIPFFASEGISLTAPGFLAGSINVANNASNSYVFADGPGASILNINATADSGLAFSDFFGNDGADTFNINGDGLGDGNSFFGGDQTDEFFLNIAVHIGQNSNSIVSVEISGDNADLDSDNRDRLIINDNNAGFVRNLNWDYLDALAGSLDILANAANQGLAGPNSALMPVQIRSMETVIFNSTGNNDIVRVSGTSADDVLTVASVPDTPANAGNGFIGIDGLTAASSAFVFLGGNPYLQSPGVDPIPDSLGLNFPGVAGGGKGPDLLIDGVSAATGITLDGEGFLTIGNQALVQLASETDVAVPGGIDYWGLGAGVLLPGFGFFNAWDDVQVNQIPNRVSAINTGFGPLLFTEVNPVSFFNIAPTPARPGLIVNTGNEAGTRLFGPLAGIVADDIVASPHPFFNIQINGNLPQLGLLDPDGLPVGDRLSLASPTSFSIWSDKASPPNVSVLAGNNPFGISYSSIERLLLSPGNGVINLIGDQNNPVIDQDDNFVVRGRDIDAAGIPPDDGFQEMMVAINGSATILIDNVQFLNVFGFDLQGQNLNNPNVNAPDNGVGGIDTLDIGAWADNSTRGWGVHVNFNEGEPAGIDGAQADLLIYTTVLSHPVSENIVIAPSGTEDGEVRVTNAVDGTTIVIINYVNNLDIIVNDFDGFLSDSDSLSLWGTNPDGTGTSGLDDFVVNLTNAGDVANPFVVVSDFGGDLYRLRTFSGFNSLNLNGLAGSDFFRLLAGRNDGSVTINITGGSPTGPGGVFDVDYLLVEGTTGLDDTFQVFPGATRDSGRVNVRRNPAFADTVVNFATLEGIFIDGAGGGGSDRVTIAGTGAADLFTVVGTGSGSGTIQVNDGPLIEFFSLGNTSSDLTLNGGDGDDSFEITHTPNWEIDDVAINGGQPTASDRVRIVGTTGADTFTYTPVTANSGQVDLLSGTTTNYLLDNVEQLAVDGAAQVDSLNVATVHAIVTPGNVPGSGVVTPIDIVGNPLLALSYTNLENVTVIGQTAVIQGTDDNDTITISNLGVVTVTNLLGFFSSVNVAGFNGLVINSRGGDDRITVQASLLFPRGIQIFGGDNGNGSDDLFVIGTPGDDVIGIDFATSNVTGVVAGPINFTGIENLTANGGGAAAGDGMNVTNFGAITGLERLFLNLNNLPSDTVSVTGTAGNDSIHFNPTDASNGLITRDGSVTEIRYSDMSVAATATLTIGGGAGGTDVLNVIGTEGSDTITSTATTVTRDDVVTIGAGIDELRIFGLGGADHVALTGIVIPTLVDGGAGNDLLRGTIAGRVTLLGGPGDDALFGSNQIDRLEGGDGNDLLVGGIGDDVAFGGNGSDTFVWNPGDNDDVFEGDSGDDTLAFAGANGNDSFVVSNDNGRVLFQRQPGNVAVSMGGVENVISNSETIELSGRKEQPANTTTGTGFANFTYNPVTGLFDVRLFVVGLSGAVTASQIHMGIPGSNGPAVVALGAGFVAVGGGSELLATGLSLASIAPPAGFSALEVLTEILLGRAYFNVLTAAFPGGEVRGNIIVSGPSAGSGGADALLLRDMTGTALRNISFDAGNEAEIRNGAPLVDTVTVEGRNLADNLHTSAVNPQDNNFLVAGLAYNVLVLGSDGNVANGANRDLLVLNGNDGDDRLQVESSATLLTRAIINGGLGNDFLSADGTINGGAGNDTLIGGPGNNALDGGTGDDTFFGNGGTDNVEGGAGSSLGDTISIVGTDGDDLIVLSLSATGLLVVNVNGVVTTYANNIGGPIASSGIEQILVQGLAGNDSLTVNSTNGAIPIPINYDGGNNFDRLVLTGGVATSNVYAVGPNVTDGTSTLVIGGVTQTVRFNALEPVLDLVAGPLTVVATNANNAINYSQGSVAANGLVTIDGFESIEFSNKGSLTINAGNGNDTININNPNTPTGLASITVNGGDPSASDTVTINGTSATNSVTFTPSTFDSGTVTGLGPVITLSTVEHLVYSGLGGNDNLTVVGTAGNDRVVVTPGTTVDSGRVAVNSLLAITFQSLGGTGSLTIAAGAGTNTLSYHGTSANETFVVQAPGGAILLTGPEGTHVPVVPNSVANLFLNGDGGDDAFDILSGHPYTTILIEGGTPSASDTVSLFGNGTPTTATYGVLANVDGVLLFTTQITGGGLGTINLVGIEQGNLINGPGPIDVVGRAEFDDFEVTPLANDSAAIVNRVFPALRLTTTNTGLLTIDGSGGPDRLTVNGTSNAETIVVNPTTVSVGALKSLNYTNTEALVVRGEAGNDIFNVTASPATAISILGGDPIGATPGDVLNLIVPAGSGTTTFLPGPESDEGGFSFTGITLPVSFNEIESVGSVDLSAAGGALLVCGTNHDDEITLIGTGVAAATISVNDGPAIAYVGLASVTIDAKAGDDDIRVTVNGLAITQISVIGSEPTTSDTLSISGTAGIDTVVFTPISSSSGSLTGLATPINFSTTEHVVYDGNDIAGLDSVLINGTFTNDTFDFDANNFQGRFRSLLSPDFDTLRSAIITVTGGGGDVDVVNLFGSAGNDVVTSVGNVIAVGTPGTLALITLGAGIDAVTINTLAGADLINLSGVLAPITATVFAGDGNDTIVGSPQNDILYGGAGDDILVGGAGDDFEYGEDGNDIFGNLTLNPDGVADDPGVDRAFGGRGFDNFVWEPGDGADINVGGEDGTDVFHFFGNAAVNTFILSAGSTPTHLIAMIGATAIENHGIEDVIVDGLGDADTFIVNDLHSTEVLNVTLNLGAADGAASDAVIVQGRALADNLLISESGANAVSVSGLRYNVNLTNAEIVDTLTVNGNDGNDQVVVGSGVNAVLALTVNGNDGHDRLDASATLAAPGSIAFIGGNGDDILIGGADDDSFDGGFGDDTFLGNGGTDAVGAGALAIGDRILVPGTPGADVLSLALNAGGHLLATINGVTTTYTNFLGGPIALSGVDLLAVSGDSGNDTLTVNSVNGAIPIAIEYDGGSGNDSLILTGGVARSDIYQVGPNPGQGTSQIVIGGVTQNISFQNIEPVLDLVAGPLQVIATPANNAINYSAGAVVANGLVTIDNFESIEFSNKTNLTIDAGHGDDVIHLNNPNTPAGLLSISIIGNDSTAGDRVIVNGTTGADIVVVDTLSADGAQVTGLGPVINIVSSESLHYNGLEGGDTLTITTPAGVDSVTATGTLSSGEGSTAITGANGDVRLPISWEGLSGPTSNLVFADAGGARVDRLTLQGTELSDTFILNNAGIIQYGYNFGAGGFLTLLAFTIQTPGVNQLLMTGKGGDDTFQVPGDHPYGNVHVDGGAPSASDVLQFVGSGAGAVTLDFGLATIQQGIFAPVVYSGIEIANVVANANFNVRTTSGDDVLSVTPGINNTATLQQLSSAPSIGATPVVNAFAIATLNVDLLAGSDRLRVNGTQAGELITLNATSVTVAGREVVNYANAEDLQVFGQSGDDTFNVFPSPTTTYFIDGGDPIGSSPGDQLNLNPPGAFVIEAGPENDEGGISGVGMQRVSWDHIEGIAVFGIGPAKIVGTNGDDDITIIARDASTHPVLLGFTPGVRDFTVSVNNGAAILFVDQASLLVDALAGDDDIVIRAPAPNNAVWNVNITVAGGAPSAVTGDQGDVLEYETPGTQTLQYTPTGIGTGVINDITNNSVITIAAFVCPVDNLPSSHPGIEELILDGEGGNDLLTVNGTNAGDRFVHTPGSRIDAGTVAVNSLLGVRYEDLGPAGTVTVVGNGGVDTLVALGTHGSDVLNIDFTAFNSIDIDLFSTAGTHVDLLSRDVQHYEIRALEGDDDLNVLARIDARSLAIFGGGPSAGSDTLNLVGAPNTVETVTVTPDATESDDQDITGLGALIDVSGVELITYTGDGDDIFIVNPGAGDNVMRVERGDDVNRVTSDSLPKIEFTGHTRFIADTSEQGSDVVTFKTWFLGAVAAAAYDMIGNDTDTLVIEGSDGANVGNDRYTITNPGPIPLIGNPNVAVLDHHGSTITVRGFNVGRLQVNTLGGDDLVVVDVGANDFISVPITFDGGSNSDTLVILQTAAPATNTLHEVTYSPGPSVVEGRLTYETIANNRLMTIDFINLEPVIDLVPAAIVTVNGTNTGNAINYIEGPNSGIVSLLNPAGVETGFVSVDNFETLEFANKTTLVIDASAGSDSINLNDGDATAPLGLTGITVNGEDPTASDRLIVNGTVAVNAIRFTPTGFDSGTVSGAQPVPVTFTTIEHLTINGLNAGPVSDTLTVVTPAGASVVTLTPGSQVDSGSVQVDNLVPMSFQSLGSAGALIVDDAVAGNRVDTLNYRGTIASDVFSVLATTGFVNLNSQIQVRPVGVTSLNLLGLEGDDSFSVTGSQPYVDGIRLQGGASANGDLANVTGDNAAAVVANVGNSATTLSTVTGGGFAGPVTLHGIETLNVNAVAQPLTVQATAANPGNDSIVVTPTSGTGGTLIANGLAPVVNFNTSATFTVDALGGSDQLTVNGSAAAETITVTGSLVTVGALKTINYLNVEALTVHGAAGSDTFNVSTSSTTSIFIDGGDPSGSIAGNLDTLNITADTSSVFSPGPESDSGGFLLDGNERLSYDQIEGVSVTDTVLPGNLQVTVNGTNADDDITLQGTATGAFTVSVNGGPAVQYTGSVGATLNGLSGDDDFDIDVNVAALGVAISVDGDLPTSSGADTLTITGVDGAAGDAPTFNPTAADAGTFIVAGTTITFVETEGVVYNGETDNETLTVNGLPGSDDVFHYIPAAAADAGSVQVTTPIATLVPLRFGNMGLSGILNLAGNTGNDTILFQGSALNDVITVAGGTGTIDHVSPSGLVLVINHIDVTQSGVENLVIMALDGDDTININGAPGATPAALHPYTNLTVQGGNPSASDVLNVNGTAGAEAIVVNLEPATITGLGGTIHYNGIEHVNFDGNLGGDTLTTNGTAIDDVINYSPTGPSAGQFFRSGENVVFGFADIDGTFTVAGGTDSADQLNLHATNGRDTITINANNRTAQVNALKAVVLAGNTEVINALGRNGQDTFIVVPLIGVVAQPNLDNLRIYVDGGDPGPSDALVIGSSTAGAVLPATHFVVVNRGRNPDSGTVRVFQDQPGAGNNPFQLPDISYLGVEIVSPNVATTANGDPNLAVIGPDFNEANEFRANATFLGQGAVIQSLNGTIYAPANEHPGVPADQDFYRVVAEKTGILDFQVYFNQYSSELLPNGGDLSLEVFDDNGNIMRTMFNGARTGNNDADSTETPGFVRASERVRIPAVAGQTYYLRVFGRQTNSVDDTYNAANTVINGYDLSIVNTPTPTPYDLELVDIVFRGTVTAGSLTSVTLAAPAVPASDPAISTVDDFYNGKFLSFLDGPQAGRRALITDYVGATRTFTLATGALVGTVPAAGNLVVIESHDTGRSQLDDYTRDSTPVIRLRLDDAIFLQDLPGNPNPNTPPDEVLRIPFNTTQTAVPGNGGAGTPAGYRIAIYDEGLPQQPSQEPQRLIGYARRLADGVYEFDFGSDALGGVFNLTNGSHFLSARVEIIDPANPAPAEMEIGYGPRSKSLKIVVDGVVPPIAFGDPAIPNLVRTVPDGLHPDSDSGDPVIPSTLADNITNDTTPTFFGRAEANSIVRLYIDRTNDGFTSDDLLAGQTVATPLDGTNQHPWGEWEITSTINVNDVSLIGLPKDGLRIFYVTAEDAAGNISPVVAANTLQLFIDTQGPQVTKVFIRGREDYNLFALKPETNQGPTPAVRSLIINIRDLPNRIGDFIYSALSNVPKFPESRNPIPVFPAIVLRGDHSGIIPLQDAFFTDDGNLLNNNPVPGGDPLQANAPATGFITLVFKDPLPDDRYTLTLKDSIIDPVGNKLDGETNGVEPNGNPKLPSGDGIPGGDFAVRFTVDSRVEIATWSQGLVYADINGNFVWDPEGQDNDFTNRDFIYNFGNVTDAYFTGNFAKPAGSGINPVAKGAIAASGFDKVGAYGAITVGSTFLYQFVLDTNDDGVLDLVSNMPAAYQVNAIPVSGNFDGNAANGDEIGAFDGQFWYLDVNGNNQIDLGERFATALRGLPLVGDFNGDGTYDLATFDNDTNLFHFDLDRNGTVDDRLEFGFTGFTDKPLAGDVNLDGVDDIILWVAGRQGQLPRESGEFHFLVSDNKVPNVANRVGTLVSQVFVTVPGFSPPRAAFSPAPLGNDFISQFGDEFALPLIGNFDPPIEGNTEPPPDISLGNTDNPLDINRDGKVNPLDALIVINTLNRGILGKIEHPMRALAIFGNSRPDADLDGSISPRDALAVINYLNRAQAEPADHFFGVSPVTPQSVDSVFSDEDDELLDMLAEEQSRLG